MERQKNLHYLVGNRVPKDFFVTSGIGESDLTIHAGSYHLALKDAGIEMCNIMTYSSILPRIAREIEKPKKLIHGCVMESILSVHTSTAGVRSTAGIIFGWLYDKCNEKYGGLVCEIASNEDEDIIEKRLNQSIEELYYNGYSTDFFLRDTQVIIKSFVPTKKYGTALVGLCFVNYEIPIEEKYVSIQV